MRLGFALSGHDVLLILVMELLDLASICLSWVAKNPRAIRSYRLMAWQESFWGSSVCVGVKHGSLTMWNSECAMLLSFEIDRARMRAMGVSAISRSHLSVHTDSVRMFC